MGRLIFAALLAWLIWELIKELRRLRAVKEAEKKRREAEIAIVKEEIDRETAELKKKNTQEKE